jgi:hypothetical protein
MKIYDYKGSVTCAWKIPTTPRQAKGQFLKLARAYARLEQARMLDYFIDDLRALKDAMFKYASTIFGEALMHPEVLNALGAIDSYQKGSTSMEIVEEKVRERAKENCNICLRDLVYPSFIAYRKGEEVVGMSKPFGIFCLKTYKGKLENLIVGYTRSASGVLSNGVQTDEQPTTATV